MAEKGLRGVRIFPVTATEIFAAPATFSGRQFRLSSPGYVFLHGVFGSVLYTRTAGAGQSLETFGVEITGANSPGQQVMIGYESLGQLNYNPNGFRFTVRENGFFPNKPVLIGGPGDTDITVYAYGNFVAGDSVFFNIAFQFSQGYESDFLNE